MGLSRFQFLKQLISKSTLQSLKTLSEPLPTTPHLNFAFNRRTYSIVGHGFSNNLHSKLTLFVAGSPHTSVLPFLDQWVQKGNTVRDSELQRIIRTLRTKKRFARALEVSEWMTSKGHSYSGDLAVRIDLIGMVHGVDAAERYFNEVNDHSQQTYGALLNCYVRGGRVDKALSHFNKMKDMGLAQNPLTYNAIMTLYTNTGQLEKIPEILSEMEDNGVSPDNVSYKICLRSYGSKSDFTAMEKLLEKMESQPHISIDWSTYSTVASCYIKGDLKERAIYYLQRAEEKVRNYAIGFNNLITMYSTLGDVSEVMRLWKKQKVACRKQINIDYMTMLGSLVKLGELEEAERIFQQWESAGTLYDFRVPNVLLIGYTQSGQVEKAEKMLEDIISKGKTPIPNSWSIIAAGHMRNDNMKKGIECMKSALELEPQHKGWQPKPSLISSMLKWLGENGSVAEAEAFVNLLRGVVPMDREIYHALLKSKVRHGVELDDVLQRMKGDNIDVDEEMEKIINLGQDEMVTVG